MGYRMFCDKCDKETDTNYVSNRVTLVFDGWKAEVMLVSRHDQVRSQQMLCESCLRDILQHGKFLGERWTA